MSLCYSLHVAPGKPAVSGDLAPGEKQRTWSPTTATLISGNREAVLVDALMTVAEARKLTDWIAATGKHLTTIYVTHGHGDHFFGASTVLERFPDARVVATPRVVRAMHEQVGPALLDGFWRPLFPDQIADRPVVAEPLTESAFELEGEPLIPVELGHSDTDNTTALHLPSIGVVIAGDAVYNDVHPYLAESADGGMEAWLGALEIIEALDPHTVIAGHKRPGADDGPHNIAETRRYIQDFAAAARDTGTALELYERVLAQHPDRVNPGVLWRSARAVKG
ncbi:MBL fold metallo-hydrolase [Plantactinospora sp. S1510]|uniref:MBL fold metallo-hydrolase n=1 Tax=Plantactinospora alkalitolerans TaxID=2789879 RepID=A0ABS0H205_9ACTN|nr:MBL fold metallo-hydrolase [Plantactinospora alkalitolerans]MBF9132177.1 MBL fold metallo-hydrolase [Plantactinospora alkalitolerans]